MHPPGIEECTAQSLCLRGLSALGMEENPVQWHLEQVAELKKLAVAMNWKETSKEYKFELKRIHLKARGEDESADTEVKQEKIKWPPFKGWVKGESGKFRDKDAARVGLLVKLHAGRWINDKNCPNSEAEEGRKAHRCVNKTAVGGPYLARLVDMDGNGKNWRVDTPHWVQEDEEEDAAPAAPPKKKKKADEEPKEAPVGGTSAEGAEIPEVPVMHGRRSKAKARK